jgi:hypothetical protein
MDKAAVEAAARKAISPLTPLNIDDIDFSGSRTNAGRCLPPYYLVYFLLVDLLGFTNLGRGEKVAWSVPVEFEGCKLIIEHRKFGLGIFAANLPADEVAAAEVAKHIHAGVKAAEPYFNFLADSAAKGSRLNVKNNSRELYERFKFFADSYEIKRMEAEARNHEQVRIEYTNGYSVSFPSSGFRREARWYAVTAIEAFFSWTEHLFIHLAIIQGRITTGAAVAKIADAPWGDKFKSALDLSNADTKDFYDKLVALRRQIRNFVAHGAFGKDGQAFSFHSGAGAVPLLLPHRQNKDGFRFGDGVEFVTYDAIVLIRDFIEHLWGGNLAPAKIYIQESGLPLILSQSADGTYTRAMASKEGMTEFTDYQQRMFDEAADMDW